MQLYIWQYQLVLDKYYVTYSEYFTIGATVGLIIGILASGILFYHGISDNKSNKYKVQSMKIFYCFASA